MDLLFKRYADPFLLINQMLSVRRFEEWIYEIMKIVQEENDEKTLWEFFLNKVYDKSFDDWKDEIIVQTQNDNATEAELETTVRESRSILDGFNPEA